MASARDDFPSEPRPNLIYSCIHRTRSTPVSLDFRTRSGEASAADLGEACHNAFASRNNPRGKMKDVPELPNHPKPVGPYSPCVVANGFVFISGQAPILAGAKSGEWAASDIGGQTHQCLRNIQSILEELGLAMRSVVRTTVLLADPADF